MLQGLVEEETRPPDPGSPRLPAPEANVADKVPGAAAERARPSPKAAPAPTPEDAPRDLELREALAAEDERLELETKRLERMERRRALDDARVRAQSHRAGGVSAPEALKLGPPGVASSDAGDSGPGAWSFGKPPGWTRAPLSPTSGEAAVAFQPSLERAESAQSAEPTRRSRQVANAAVERVREMTKTKQAAEGKLSLTIRIDDATEVKLRISPRGDGTHELAFLVADPRLKHELRRALPEIRDAASELPINVTDVWIDDMVDDEESSTFFNLPTQHVEPKEAETE
jgi:hypothetical protein